jgi:DNA-binding HxlR family transcriptional regulator
MHGLTLGWLRAPLEVDTLLSEMRRARYAHSGRRCDGVCPAFQKGMDVLERPWNGLLLAALAYRGPLRFCELATLLPDLSDRVLSERLRDLHACGVIMRTSSPDPERTNRTVVLYAMTERQAQAYQRLAEVMGAWAALSCEPSGTESAEPAHRTLPKATDTDRDEATADSLDTSRDTPSIP